MSIDYDSYDQNYKRERNERRNKIVNKILVNIEEKPKITNETSTTIQPRHGDYTGQRVGRFWIRTLSKGKQKPSSLNQEDKDILKTFGSDGSGVSVVDSRESYFDSGSGTWY